MRRVARHLFTLCSAVSLVLCVAVCVLWVRSYWVSDWFTVVTVSAGDPATYRSRQAVFGGGAVTLDWTVVRRDAATLHAARNALVRARFIPYSRTGPFDPLAGVGTLGVFHVPHSQG